MSKILVLAGVFSAMSLGAFAQDCKLYNKETALNDIKAGEAVLLVQGGFISYILPTDTTFARKYNVKYANMGCVRTEPEKCMIAYNNTIEAWLDKTYGKVWRKEVRKDVF